MKALATILILAFCMQSIAGILYEARESEGFLKDNVFVIHYTPVKGKISSKRKLVMAELGDLLEKDEITKYRFFSDKSTGEALDCIELSLTAGSNDIAAIIKGDKSIQFLAIVGGCDSVQVK